MNRSLSSRLAALYTLLLGITVVLVIVASSIALVYELNRFSRDIIIAKHDEARTLAEQYKLQGVSLDKAAADIARELSGIGLQVTVFNTKGKYLAGDKTLRPPLLAKVVQGRIELIQPPGSTRGNTIFGPFPLPIPTGRHGHNRTTTMTTFIARGPDSGDRRLGISEPRFLIGVDGGYIAFMPSPWVIFANLEPYWLIIVSIGIVAILLSWFIGRVFSRQALAPLTEVTGSLQALAGGDYTQRRFATAGGDEIAQLTEAYNDAAANVASAMDERKNTEARMRQFVADAGHELRTPLTVIAGYIDVLRRGAIEEPKVARQILGTMVLEKEHMRGLIDRLMRLARMDAEAPPQPMPINVRELLRDQCEATRRLDESRQIDYSVEGVDEIFADRAELGEALWNIIENALKYAPDAPIHLRAVGEEDHVLITVRDEGPGMTEGERLHAFERFYRGDARGSMPGTGLGLAIAKRAVDRAGGTITIDSAPGHGTTVTIRLPQVFPKPGMVKES
ncbi:MAG TPA: HAMP domain-containing sensor histidine kinase [Candidatus Rubrimentiphilum sp.]|nr:HAMP domain-containing sensor histidine kinase [Candidatus Rubrimentiphilum sp.]